MTADNPRRGSATGQVTSQISNICDYDCAGMYGLPVPPDNLKLGGSSHFQSGTVLNI